MPSLQRLHGFRQELQFLDLGRGLLLPAWSMLRLLVGAKNDVHVMRSLSSSQLIQYVSRLYIIIKNILTIMCIYYAYEILPRCCVHNLLIYIYINFYYLHSSNIRSTFQYLIFTAHI